MATDADEALARRLQQEEFGSLLPGSFYGMQRGNTNNNSTVGSQDISAPLLDDNNNENNDIPNNPLLNGNNDNIDDDNNNNNNNDINIPMQQQGGNAAQRARRNVIGHVRDADTDSPRILLLRITIALLEIIATSTILAIGWNEGGSTSCSYLKWWALIYTARHFITIPLRIHIRYRVNHGPNNNDNGDQNNNNAGVVAEKSIQILRWLSILTFLLFLLGQTFLFTEKTCQTTAPTVWYYCLVIIILVYVSLALPFLIVLAICICLPCVLIIFRFFAEPEGADDRIIKDLPTRKITADELRQKDKTKGGDDDDNNNNETKDEDKKETNDDEEEDDDDDAPSCAICMQDYKVDDELRILPCGHEFHCECVDKWLPMKKICPLCRHDVTKKVQSSRNNSNSNINNNNNNNNDNQQEQSNNNSNNNDNNNNNNNDEYQLVPNDNSVNNSSAIGNENNV